MPAPEPAQPVTPAECDCSQDCKNTPCEEICPPLAEPVCTWGDYCSWSECTKECGGRRIRSRSCICPESHVGEPDCHGEMFDFDDESCDACVDEEDLIRAALAPTESTVAT